MNLLSLPEEVVEGHLLPFLEWNDLLRFRRVCKSFHGVVKGYMKAHPERTPEIEINEKERTFGAFMKLDIPTYKLFLNNVTDLGHGLYEKQWNDVEKFLEKYGQLVKSLRVKQISLYVCGKELEFVEALVNLEEFEAGHYALGTSMKEAVLKNLKRANHHPPMSDCLYPVPENFAGLKVLKIGRCDETLGELVPICNPLGGSTLFDGRQLEYVTPPMGKELVKESPLRNLTLTTQFMYLAEILKLVKRDEAHGKLKVIDFIHHHEILPGDEGRAIENGAATGSTFYRLLQPCIEANVMLKNVSGLWFRRPLNPLLTPRLDVDFHGLGSPILSLINLHPNVLLLELDNLERLEIRQTSNTYVGTEWRQPLFPPQWPALQSLDIYVDSSRPRVPQYNAGLFGGFYEPGQMSSSDMAAGTKVLFAFLFQGFRRTALTELRLCYSKDDGSLPIPKMENVVSSCPNLKKLVLVKWPGTNKALVTLFSGLPGLEEVSLEYCKNLGNVAFVGEDQQNPVFFKLKKLKKLSLKGLDQMPKVTDTLFSMVIRHMSLTHFIVTSDAPLESVTLHGVESLLESKFAESIQKFPFQTWSLAKITSEEWHKLEKKFRSYEML